MSESSPARTCTHCGSALPTGMQESQCPRCLMAQVIEPTQEGETPPPLPPLTPEELAPHFPQLEILECLGRGGMGVVYKARQKSLNRLVALKLLAPERADDPQFAARFEKEAHALAALNHPHIVGVHDFGQAGGFYFLLMEFVDGVNLRQLMQAKKLTAKEALSIVPPVCEALQCAHDHGIVHRDIKPENLLIDKAGVVKIADFGIAKMVAHASFPDFGSDSRTTFTLGTPDYAAPEHATGTADHRADIYSLGVVLYEMLTGERPGEKLEAPSKRVQVDVRIDEIVLKALEKTPELRFATAAEFRTQVEAATVPFPPGVPPLAPIWRNTLLLLLIAFPVVTVLGLVVLLAAGGGVSWREMFAMAAAAVIPGILIPALIFLFLRGHGLNWRTTGMSRLPTQAGVATLVAGLVLLLGSPVLNEMVDDFGLTANARKHLQTRQRMAAEWDEAKRAATDAVHRRDEAQRASKSSAEIESLAREAEKKHRQSMQAETRLNQAAVLKQASEQQRIAYFYFAAGGIIAAGLFLLFLGRGTRRSAHPAKSWPLGVLLLLGTYAVVVVLPLLWKNLRGERQIPDTSALSTPPASAGSAVNLIRRLTDPTPNDALAYRFGPWQEAVLHYSKDENRPHFQFATGKTVSIQEPSAFLGETAAQAHVRLKRDHADMCLEMEKGELIVKWHHILTLGPVPATLLDDRDTLKWDTHLQSGPADMFEKHGPHADNTAHLIRTQNDGVFFVQILASIKEADGRKGVKFRYKAGQPIIKTASPAVPPAKNLPDTPSSSPQTSAESALQMRWVLDTPSEDTQELPLMGDVRQGGKIETLHVQKAALLDETALESVNVVNDAQAGTWGIEFLFTESGGQRFAELTREAKGRKLAIVIDRKLYAAPVITGEIAGGRAVIQGNWPEQVTRALAAHVAVVLKAAKGRVKDSIQAAPSKQASAAPPADWIFGPTKSQALSVEADGVAPYFQFAEGKTVMIRQPPAATVEEFGEDWDKANAAGGVDFTLRHKDGDILIRQNGCAFGEWLTVQESVFLSANQAHALGGELRAKNENIRLVHGQWPVSCLFRTAKGLVGLMTVTHVKQTDGKPPLLSFDYKLVRRLEAMPQTVDQFFQKGAALWDQRDFPEVVWLYDEATKKHPAESGFFNNRANAHTALQQYEQALADFAEALRLSPGNENIYRARAVAYHQMGDYDHALTDLDIAVKASPEGVNYALRGRAHHARGEFRNALADYEKGIQATPGYTLTYLYLAWLLATCPDDTLRDAEKASQFASMSWRLLPDFQPETFAALAAAHAETGDYAAAIRHEQAALDKLPPGSEQAAQSQDRLKLYQAHQPMRSPKPLPIDFWRQEASTVPEKASEFPQDTHITKNNRSVLAVHGDVALHYVFYFLGDIKPSTRLTHNAADRTWNDEGEIKLPNETKISFKRRSTDDWHLIINTKEFDLRFGRVFVLHTSGLVEQREEDLPLATALDPDAVAKFIEEGSSPTR